ncbi:precorrin-6y C5,15-methyltransferase (decarboxylating), CbiE subunit [Desulfobulbus propionicus DSM 2032]|uniref:Precorrin-6y C5,15-methyltransferase (Decarboxylating), CbiE subunit n=1 Tax=Desulfobulbus propionicus (strain ATCC 33891 / DSM 2032 / VKM B-1956 / 1pr3) TaxID=577650 RepID=A0A7U3YPJ4_DESPD|nr:bifunctional cobalt-precorrin-7 (C(5))-methyltransferase/cobalt-precorrin-6B (C(15))-methyltransferase [Desulfobulbus propionicus]ADW19155.1 precorrin-6y C5,15-methyltransferase (decarboxylating), CbiE subunit [Desulfobulbus propionicus DSM 2032]
MSRIELIGISGKALNSEQWPILRRCRAIVASRRHRPLVAGLLHPLIDIAPVDAMLHQVDTALIDGDVAVLASGDPLFYGIGRTLIARFGADRLRIHPALSAVQLACARFRLPWDDLTLLSLHGRTVQDLAGRILGRGPMMLFTDSRNSPDRVAATLLNALTACEDRERIAAIRIRVAENLGLADERLTSGSLAEIAAGHFSALNMMLIEQPQPSAADLCFGLREDEILHSRGLITKDEVRAATLHRLRLPATGVFWDIGGGSGSVSLEAARMCPDLSIHTIEKKPEEQANIRANIRRYGAYAIHLVSGEAPDALANLPAPDRIFIGGSGQRLEPILEAAVARLAAGGRIVVNAVLEQTETTALAALQRLGLRVASSTLAVNRRLSPDSEPRVFNPITLITGDK